MESSCDESGSPPLHRLKFVFVGLGVRVPYHTGILQDGTYHGLVGCLFELGGADLEVSPHETQYFVLSICTDVVDVLVPVQVMGDGNP